MDVLSLMNTAKKPADVQVPLVSNNADMRVEFQTWLSAGNAKKYTPEIMLSCMDRISEYALRKKISSFSIWEYIHTSAFNPLYKKLVDAKLLRITDHNTYKVFIVAGQLYLRFLKEKPFAHKEVATTIKEKEVDSAIVIKKTQQEDINADDVVAWLTTQPNANCTLYLDNVLRSYMSVLRNVPQKLVLPESANRNVFACHTVAELDDTWTVFKESPNYVDVNRTPWHGQLSAGLAIYRRYLEHLESDEDAQTFVVLPSQSVAEVAVKSNDAQAHNGIERVDFDRPEQCAQTKPMDCLINGQPISPSKWNWSQLLVAITEHFIAQGYKSLEILERKPLYGSKAFFLTRKAEFGTCAELLNGKWIYTNYNPQTVVTIIGRLCLHCGVSLKDVNISYEPKGGVTAQTPHTLSRPAGAAPVIQQKPELDSTVIEKLTAVLSSHFSNGYRLNSPIEMMRFRSFAADDLGDDVALSDEDLKSYIAACGTNFEGKVYVVSVESKERIKALVEDYFTGGAQVIFFAEFYAKNDNWLFGASVISEDMLVGILHRLFPSLSFTQTYFGYTNASVFSVLESEILRVWDGDMLLTYAQLAERLPYIPLDRIKYVLGQNGDFIWNSVETFSHISQIEITDDEREAIRAAAIRECNARGYVSITDLPFGEIEERNYELSITAVHNAVYRICLADKFDKRGKIVTRKGDVFDALTIMKEHCRTIEKCSLDDLLNFEKELTGEVHRWVPMEAANSVLVRIDKETYVADRFVRFDTDKTDEAIELMVKGDYLPLKAFTTFGAFPYCGQTWNLFLLESYCRRFSRKFRFDTPSVNSRNAGTVIRKSCGMDYTEIMTDAVANADVPLQEAAVGRFLFDNGYTGRSTNAKVTEIIDKAKALRERRD